MVKITVHDAEHWITVHPNGNKEEKGTPLLIEGSNGHYVVKGGAGGKLNGKEVKPKSMSKARAGTEGEQPKGEEPKGETQKEQPKYASPTVTSSHNEAHAGLTEALGAAGIKHKRHKHEGETVIAVPEYGAQWTPEQQKAIQEAAIAHGYTYVKGIPIDPNEYKEGRMQYNFHHGYVKGEAPKPEAPKEQPKSAVKKTEVSVEKSDNQFERDPYLVHAQIGNGSNIGMRFTEKDQKAGIVDAFKGWLADNGAHLSGAMRYARSAKDKGVEEFLLNCEKDKYEQISVHGDPTGSIRMEEAENRLKEVNAEITVARKKRSEHIRAAQQKRLEAEAKHEQAQKTWKQGAYQPQKTAKAAAEWAVKNNYATAANYGKLSTEVANASNESLARHIQEFPELRKHMPFIGSCQEMNKWRNVKRAEDYKIDLLERGYSEEEADESVKKYCKPKSVVKLWAFAAFSGGVGFNEKWGNPKGEADLQASLKRSLESQFHPVGCDTVKSIYDHEFGHQLDFMLKASDDPEMVALRRDLINRKATKTELSGYALEDKYEFIAEGWAEYLNNPNPRPVAKQIGEKIRSLYAAKFGKPAAAA